MSSFAYIGFFSAILPPFQGGDKMTHRIKRKDERVILYRMIIDFVQTFDAAFKQLHGRPAGSSLGASLEDYFIKITVLVGDAEGRCFTAHKLSTFLGMPRSTVDRRLRHLEKIGVIERVSGGKYRLGSIDAEAAGQYIDDLINLVETAAAKLSKIDTVQSGHKLSLRRRAL
jgi:hypothetical protein